MSTAPRGEAPPAIVRVRITLREVKPTVWRKLEVSLTATLADLHAAIQAAMDWEDVHLHCFRIFGRRYDSEHGLLSEDVRLADLRLRSGERFSYVYNHSAPWEHELRVEAIGPGRPGRHYPRCIAGQHVCPPEWCTGPEAYDEIKAELLGLSYSEDLQLMADFGNAVLAARNGTVRDLLEAVDVDQIKDALRRHERREELIGPFDRQHANRALALLATAAAATRPA
ncbi:MAG: plasmid pRiA4b ORF-3 family protein [Acetobacteraceae bacterium]|nr:plasmid pRiA4b ORF-3 family protein [Acetobacteraceae bacterium]